MIARVKNQIWAVDPHLPVYEVQTMEQVVDQSTSERRFESFLMSIFAGLALVLASVGIYGVLSSLVSQRTQEIGIRMALGAQMRDVLRMVLSEGFRLVLLGVVIGTAGGFALSRYLSSLFSQSIRRVRPTWKYRCSCSASRWLRVICRLLVPRGSIR